jgi:replicative DNA helicase
MSTAERQLLAALVSGRDIEPAALARPEHFTSTRHAALWRAGWEIIDAGARVTPIALERALAQLEAEPIPLDEIAAFDSAYTSEQDIREAAVEVRRLANLRELRDLGGALIEAAKHPAADPDRLASEYHERLAKRDGEQRTTSLGDAMRKRYIEARQEAAGEGQIRRVPTGLRGLNIALKGGWRPGWQVVLGARPGMGKSALALRFATAASVTDPVIVFSAEMMADELAERALAAASGVTLDAIEQGPGRMELEKLGNVAEVCSRMRVEVDDRTDDIGGIARECRRWRRRNPDGTGVIVVDYVQLIRGERHKGDTREQEVAQVSRTLKALAQELGCCTVVLSQLNRSLEQRGEGLKDPRERAFAKRPRLSDLRESGSLEQDANVVMFLFRPAAYEPEAFGRGQAEVAIAKFRGGRAPQTVRLVFAPTIALFGEEHDR